MERNRAKNWQQWVKWGEKGLRRFPTTPGSKGFAKRRRKKSVKFFFKVRAAQWQLITYAGTSASRGNWAIKVGSGAEKVREAGKNFRMSTAFNPFTRRKVRRKSV